MELKIYRMNSFVPALSYATQDSACFDLSACLEDKASVKGFYVNNESVVFVCLKDVSKGISEIKIPPRARVLVPTGLIFDIPHEHCIKVYPRSGLSVKKGLGLCNSVGIIDSDYIEEVFIPIINHSDEELTINHGDRIAQAELVFVNRVNVVYIQDKPETKTNRVGGFGSTGLEWNKSL